MRKHLLLSLLAVLFVMPKIMATAADEVKEPAWGKAELVEQYTLGPGIQYQKIIYPDMPLILWYTVIDLTNPLNRVEQAQSRNQVPDVYRWDGPTYYTQNSREGHKVKVMWNHDFFSYDQGICIGNNISNGEMTWRKWGRSLLAITKAGTAEVFNPDRMECKVTTPDNTSVEIDYYNQQALQIDGDCVLYNRFNATTLSQSGKYIKIIPQGEWTVNGADIPCKVTEISDSPLQTSATEYVIYLRGSKLNSLDGHVAVGDVLNITQKFNGASWGTPPADIMNAFHGYPSIAHDGVFHDGEYNNFESGREYEKSAHVMAGISKDKTKLYMLINEMSGDSKAVDCVELTSWMINRGAWDVVNFDSGGSATIVVDNEMLNIPGRGSVRPVQDAMLAVSLAPTDNAVHHYTFSKPSLNPAVISLTPLRVLSFNQYDEVLDKDLKGCTFTCEPAELGYVDSEAVFHSGTKGTTGKIIATKDGVSCEIPVTTIPANSIYPKYSTLLTDNHRKYLIEVLGNTESETLKLDPAAFNWASSNPDVCNVTDGMLIGKSNGTSTLTASFEDISFNIDVKVETSDKPVVVGDFSNLDNFIVTKSSVSNIEVTSSPLPSGWNEGNVLKFDYTAGRNPYIKFELKNKTLYGIPDSLSLIIQDNHEAIKSATIVYKDNFGLSITKTVDAEQVKKGIITVPFIENDQPYELSRFPLNLYTIQFNLNATNAGTGVTIPIRSLNTYYPGMTGVENVVKNNDEKLALTVGAEVVNVSYNSLSAQNATLLMYSTTGNLLYKEKVALSAGQNELVINTKEAVTGIYIVALQTPQGTIVGKCIIR